MSTLISGPDNAARALVLAATAVAASGCSRSPGRLPPQHPSVAEHERRARVHDRAAASAQPATPEPHGRAARPPKCLDRPIEGVHTSGGEPVEVIRPCWTSIGTVGGGDREGERHRRAARYHRGAAKKLLVAEREACAGLGAAERSESPFWHRDDILFVAAQREDGVLKGARVRFRAVSGLTPDWFVRAARCHQARAAVLGYPRTFMAYCPMALPDVEIRVRMQDDALEVTVTSDRSEIATAVLARARDLISGP